MAVPQPTPLIQIAATSIEQCRNSYAPLQSMVRNGPLATQIKLGEEFSRIGTNGRIETVTASATARLGAPITYAVFEETGIWTDQNRMTRVAETMRRGLAGMGGRSIEVTNAFAPDEHSVAQRTWESQAPDVFKWFPQPPANLSVKNKRDRRKILEHVYAGSGHVDFDTIEAEIVELMETNPAAAQRFFLNKLVAGTGAWIDPAYWEARKAPRFVKPGTRIVLGFDGSDVNDHSVIRAQTMDGYQFTPRYGPDQRLTHWDPAEWGGQVPRQEVHAAIDELFRRYDVAVLYADPPGWESELDAWADRFGEKRVIRFHTRRIVQMHDACERFRTDLVKEGTQFTHDGCEVATRHVLNARTAARPQDRYVLRKEADSMKIDAAVSSVLANEAMNDCIAAGKAQRKKNYYWGI